MLMLLTAAALPRTGRAADKDLEDRVRALERKLDQEQKGTATEQKSVTDRIDAIEKEVKDNEKTLADKTGISIHAMVAVDYLYDLNAPAGSTVNGFAQPFLRTFENEKNSFILNLGNLHFERTADNLPGFVVDVDFGKTADVVNNTTYFGRHGADPNNPANSIPITGNGTDFFDARQFYLTYTVPVGSGIKMKVGRFVTLAGAEVIKSYNSFNYNVTNSILFGFAIPFTHTGIMTSYAFSDQVSLDFGLVNGWDTVADNNDGKSIHSGLTLAFDPHITFYQTFTYGPEQTGRTVLDNNGVPLAPDDQAHRSADADHRLRLRQRQRFGADQRLAAHGAVARGRWLCHLQFHRLSVCVLASGGVRRHGWVAGHRRRQWVPHRRGGRPCHLRRNHADDHLQGRRGSVVAQRVSPRRI
jgi:hypothetical protein